MEKKYYVCRQYCIKLHYLGGRFSIFCISDSLMYVYNFIKNIFLNISLLISFLKSYKLFLYVHTHEKLKDAHIYILAFIFALHCFILRRFYAYIFVFIPVSIFSLFFIIFTNNIIILYI